MKAIRVHEFGADVLKLEEIENLQPAAGRSLVRVKAGRVNPYDTYMRAGPTARVIPNFRTHPVRTPPGRRITGSGVTDCAIGDRVFTSGTITGAYAETRSLSAQSSAQLAETISFAQGAGFGFHTARLIERLFQLVTPTG